MQVRITNKLLLKVKEKGEIIMLWFMKIRVKIAMRFFSSLKIMKEHIATNVAIKMKEWALYNGIKYSAESVEMPIYFEGHHYHHPTGANKKLCCMVFSK